MQDSGYPHLSSPAEVCRTYRQYGSRHWWGASDSRTVHRRPRASRINCPSRPVGRQGSQSFYHVRLVNPSAGGRILLLPELYYAARAEQHKPVLGSRSNTDRRYRNCVPRCRLEGGRIARRQARAGMPVIVAVESDEQRVRSNSRAADKSVRPTQRRGTCFPLWVNALPCRPTARVT